MQLIDFKTVATNYKVIFFDAFGVLKNSEGILPGIEKTFDWLRENGKDFYVLTNDASRGPHELAESYYRQGFYAITPERIISSGMLAREYLDLKVHNGTVAYLGTEKSAHYLQTTGLTTLPISHLDLKEIDDINALVLLDDEGFDWNTDLTKTVNLLRKRNIPVIVANTDATYPVSKNRISIAIGAVAKMIEGIVGKQFIRFGKPDAQLFMFAYERLDNAANISKRDILMVGDTLKTDILGGNKFGLDTALVLTGNTQPQDVEVQIRSTGIIPTYVCKSVVIR
ncbi:MULTISPECIES: TIGR01459 family HAD-type hydrolase [unclassified Spirosoma]|uniref:TIGR01459 family HAD-type hydrolase n=1 Tax=unclassified Spirosoma TaxID=2621999 RepID=UPI00096053D2|nr:MULTISPECIES: TIGR01459 family HAD-type hydrolase [unclassified Spirosoma]MBN8823136.1 TIGR01459 family HAD-type hydrolase [Spirosoma sp.]OJW73222.1 MAG: haloacid dehalogenase [Spirosoma sp. 48-14]